VANTETDKPPRRRGRFRSGFPAGLFGGLIGVAALASGGMVSNGKEEFGAFLALTIACCATGALVGFLVGSPGLAMGDDAADKANERGWASRLGVFGNWITGAAFVLVSANAGKIVEWFASVTRKVAGRVVRTSFDAVTATSARSMSW